jgi:hypothetical protein
MRRAGALDPARRFFARDLKLLLRRRARDETPREL